MLGNIFAFAFGAFMLYSIVKSVIDIVKKIKNRGKASEEENKEA